MGGVKDRIKTQDVFVLIPGIMGSALTMKRGKGKEDLDLWSPSFGAIGRAVRHRTKNLLALKLDHEPRSLEELPDNIVVNGLMPDVHIIPRFWKIDGYGAISGFVREQFDVTPGENFFEFPYDWRIDNRLNAQLLAQKAEGWLKARSDPKAKLVILAHSMGGLVARFFIEVLGGWKVTRRLFTIGTPHRGSLDVLDFLVNGYRPVMWGVELPELEVFTQLVRSFTSTYQLLPTYPCYEVAPGKMQRASEIVGVGGLVSERAAAGLAFHEEIRLAHAENVKLDEYHRERYELHAVVGTHQETSQSVGPSQEGFEVRNSLGLEDHKGDGTVPFASALPREIEDEPDKVRTLYVPEKHSRLQNAKQVHDQIGGTLRTASVNLAAYRDVEHGLPLALDLSDAFLENERIRFRVRCEDDWTDLTATLFDAASGAKLDTLAVSARANEPWRLADRDPLPSGTYRVEVSSQKPSEAQTVSDVFTVL